MCQCIGQLLQDGEIDLSGQALNPVNVHTLGLFIDRYFKKNWKLLNISNCFLGTQEFECLFIFCNNNQDTRQCVVRPKKPARHTVGILTGRKKTSFSHLCISMIPYTIRTKFMTEFSDSQGSIHTKLEGNRSSHFRDTSCKFSIFSLRNLCFCTLAKICIKRKRVLRSP